MKTRTILGLIIISLLAASSAFAQSEPADADAAKLTQDDLTVFGVRLGEKLTLPECDIVSIPRLNLPGVPPGRGHMYSPTLSTISKRCFERRGLDVDLDTVNANTPVVTGTVLIAVPLKELREGVPAMTASVVDGNIEKLSFYTNGRLDQDYWLQQLTLKYGKPTHYEEVNKQNGLGAVFVSRVARWRFTNLSVDLEGIASRIDEGSVEITTSKGLEFLADHPKQQVGPKL